KKGLAKRKEQSMKRGIRGTLLAFVLLGLVLTGFQASPSHAQGSVTDVKVMTYNIDEGTDFGPILAARSFNDLLTDVAQTYNEVQASNFAERSAGFAIKVESTQPDFIALQELSTWRTGPLNHPPATNVQLDHLQSILQALASRGLSYTPIAVQTNLD